MERQVKCHWCGEQVTPVVNISTKQYGDVKERRCPKCDAVIAAYLDEPGVILEKVRLFQG